MERQRLTLIGDDSSRKGPEEEEERRPRKGSLSVDSPSTDLLLLTEGRKDGTYAAAFSPSVNEDGGGGRRDDFECGRWIHDSLDPSPRLIDGTKLPG